MNTQRQYCIPTTYRGIRFRSKSEAITAGFFDTHGILWVYEPEGFAVKGVCYLPDFYLPVIRTFVEVKPVMFLDECTKFETFMEAMRDSYGAWILTVENNKVLPVSMLINDGDEEEVDEGWHWFDVGYCWGEHRYVNGRYYAAQDRGCNVFHV